MKTHPVVSVTHLKQARPDPYQREISAPEAIIVEGKKQYVVERIVRREKRNKIDGYIVKWKGYQEKTWESASTLRQDMPDVK